MNLLLRLWTTSLHLFQNGNFINFWPFSDSLFPKNRAKFCFKKSLLFTLVALIILPFHSLSGASLQDKVLQGQIGDYAVMANGGIYTILILRTSQPDSIEIDEISISEADFIKKKLSWSQWLSLQAPNHSSWTTYTINPITHELAQWYSHSQKNWLKPNEPNQLLSKLLALSLEPIPLSQRKKIGPTPEGSDLDHRKLWTPRITIEGAIVETSSIQAVRGTWPDDHSILSGTSIELYFSSTHSFPYWIDIKSPHYTACIRVVDSGKISQLAFPPLPEKPPEFVGTPLWKGEFLEIKLKTSNFSENLRLFALAAEETSPPISIPCQMTLQGDIVLISIKKSIVETRLSDQNSYKWLLVSPENSKVIAESSNQEIPPL